MNRSKAFTLLELLMAVAVVSVTIAVALPYLSGMTKNQLADRLYRELENDIRFARSYAVTHSIRVEFKPNLNWKDGWIIRAEDASGAFKNVIRENKVNAGNSILGTKLDNSKPLIFSEQGRASETTEVTINVTGCEGTRVRTLFINRVGQVILKGEQLCK